MDENHAAAWYQRYRNYWLLKSSSFDRTKWASINKDCWKTEQLFRKAFMNEKNTKGEPLHKFNNVNHHVHAFHWVPVILFNGPTLLQSTQKFERYHQLIKNFAESTNQQDLFRDIMTAVRFFPSYLFITNIFTIV